MNNSAENTNTQIQQSNMPKTTYTPKRLTTSARTIHSQKFKPTLNYLKDLPAEFEQRYIEKFKVKPKHPSFH